MENINIDEYRDYYKVTRDGKVWSVRKNRFLSPGNNSGGYLFVLLVKAHTKPKVAFISRLVALTYIPLPEGVSPDSLDVDHINRDIQDNSVDNLRWCTHKENMKNRIYTKKPGRGKGYTASDETKDKMSAKKKKPITINGIEYPSRREAAIALNISPKTIYRRYFPPEE